MSLPVRAIRAESDGRFEFADLAAGTFRVAAYVPGYTPPRDDALVLPGMPMMGGGPTVTVSAGQVRDAVQIKMSRLGVLAGRVLDEHGDPVEGARVQLLTIKYRGGRRRLVDAGFAARTTNDRGEYRLHDVPNGRYIVSVSIGAVGSNDIPGYTRSYFPSTANPGDAQFVALAETDRIGVDVSLVPTRTALVSGRIYNAAGEPSTGGHVELRPSSRSASAAVSVPVGARLLPDGAFEFPNVEPGEYVVEADRGRSNQSTEGEFGTTLVTVVDSDVTNVVVQMSAGSSITGRFVFDTADPNKRPARDAIELVATGVDPDRTPSRTASAAIHDDWTFMMAGINGPRRLDLLRLPPEWMLKQVHVRGIDITDQPIAFGKQDQSLADVEVALTDRVTTLSGRIVDDNGHPAAGSHVIVFSTDRTRWYPLSRFLREMPTWEDGIFKITGLPPESYYVAVVARLDEGDEAWQDPAYLDTLTLGSTTITIGEGQRQLLNLRLPTP
jgi:protocatechuate 3,4-dioxygenase beta subunit